MFTGALFELYNEQQKIVDTNLKLVPFCRTLEDILRLGLHSKFHFPQLLYPTLMFPWNFYLHIL